MTNRPFHTRVEVSSLGWDEALVRRAVDLTYDVVGWNGNRRGVRDTVACVTDDLDVVYTYAVKRDRNDRTNYGTCFYTSWWDATRVPSHVTAAIIHVSPTRQNVSNAVTTLSHELAHAVTQGAHGYTWRRMFTLLTPLVWKVFDHPCGPASGRLWLDLRDTVQSTVTRYASRTHGGYVGGGSDWYDDGDAEFLSRMDKLEREIDKHVRASRRCFDRFGG